MPSITLTGALSTIEVSSDYGVWLLSIEEWAAPFLKRGTAAPSWRIELQAKSSADSQQTLTAWRQQRKQDRTLFGLQPGQIMGFWYDDPHHTRVVFRTSSRVTTGSIDFQKRIFSLTLDPDSKNTAAALLNAVRDTYRRAAKEAVPSRVFAHCYVASRVAWLPNRGLRTSLSTPLTAAGEACIDGASLLTHGLPRPRSDDAVSVALSEQGATLAAVAVAQPRLAHSSGLVSLASAQQWLDEHLFAPVADPFGLLQNLEVASARKQATERLLKLPWLAVAVPRDWQDTARLLAAARKPA